MTEDNERIRELKHALKLLGRTLALICLASLLWHAPITVAILAWVSTAMAVIAAVIAGILILVSAAVWRNLMWRETAGRFVSWRGGPIGSAVLCVPPLLVLCALAALVFVFFGWLLR